MVIFFALILCMAQAPRSIEDQIRSFCAYQERCSSEVELKLRKLNVPRERWYEFVDKMIDEGFLDDVRFTRAFVRGKFRMKGWGKLMIIHGLQGKGIARELIQAAIESEIDPEEYHRTACRLVEGTGLGLDTNEEVAQIQQKLARKGFNWGEIRAAIDELRSRRQDEDQ